MTGTSSRSHFLQRAVGWCEAAESNGEDHLPSCRLNPDGCRFERIPSVTGDGIPVNRRDAGSGSILGNKSGTAEDTAFVSYLSRDEGFFSIRKGVAEIWRKMVRKS